MKKIFLLTIIALIGLPVVSNIYAQEEGSLRERIARRQAQQEGNTGGNRQLTLRAQLMNDSQTQDISNVTWMREVYRFLDMEKDENAALYYPVRPIGKRMNFFTMIFNKILDGDIDVYKFQIDGSERFSDEYKMKIDSSFFYGMDIPFEHIDGKYMVDPSSIPSEEVRGYYMKETWYFDKNNSVVDIKTIAVCPVMIYQAYDAGMERTPLFWVPYESVRPYASQMPIMVSSLNNASTQTINDFFVKHNFDGEIYKTTNMRNLTLNEQFEGDSLKKEQQKIEKQLQDFKNNLWVYNDSIDYSQGQAVAKTKTVRKAKNTTGNAESSSGEVSNRAEVQREAQQQKSAPTRSMRNRRRN